MLSDGLSSVVLVIEKGFDNLTNGGTSLDTNSSACCGFKIDFFTKKYFLLSSNFTFFSNFYRILFYVFSNKSVTLRNIGGVTQVYLVY